VSELFYVPKFRRLTTGMFLKLRAMRCGFRVQSTMKNAMTVLLLIALLGFAGCGGAALTPRENPFKKDLRVGDWVEYRIAHNANGLDKVLSMKNVVTEVSAESVTLHLKSTEVDKFEILDRKDFDPYRVPGTEVSVRELGTGSEKIKIGSQEYDCKWYEVEVTPEGSSTPWTVKEWVSPAVPLSGRVKMTMRGPGNTFEHTVEGFGRGK